MDWFRHRKDGLNRVRRIGGMYCANTRRILEGIDKNDIVAVSTSGQMNGCLPLDSHGIPLHNAIIWSDGRAVEESESIKKSVGEKRFFEITGMDSTEGFGLPKIMWLKKYCPDIYWKTYSFLQSKDFIVQRLCGEFVTELTDAQYMHCFDIWKSDWSGEILDAVGISGEKMPRVVLPGSVVGKVSAQAAEECGLAEGTPVVEGLGDGRAALIGTGVLDIGDAYINLGTSSWVSMLSRLDKPSEEGHDEKIVFVKPGIYAIGGDMNASGYCFEWMKKIFCGTEKAEAEKRQYSESQFNRSVDALAAQAPAGSGGILFVPSLFGERAPYFDYDARGAFLGLHSKTTRAELCRSVLEGVAFHLNLLCHVMQKSEKVNSMRIVGGGAKSWLWKQIIADIFGIPLIEPAISNEAGSLGIAVMAGIGIGLFPGISVVKKFQSDKNIIYPIEENVERYAKLQKVYDGCYSSLKGINHNLAKI